MLGEIVENIVQSQPDMELVRRDAADTLDIAVKRLNADVAVLGDRACIGGASPEQLLIANPGLKLVVVTTDGACAEFFEFRRRSLVNLSPQSLVNTIRACYRRDG